MALRGCLGCCDDLCFEKRGLNAAVVVAGVELTRWRSSGLRRELTYLMRERARERVQWIMTMDSTIIARIPGDRAM